MAAPGVDADRWACADRLAEVTRRTRAQQSAQQIAWDLDIAVRTVEDYRARARAGDWVPYAGTGVRELPADLAAAVAVRYGRGESQQRIATALGLSRHAVITAMAAAGVAPRTASEANTVRWSRIRSGPGTVSADTTVCRCPDRTGVRSRGHCRSGHCRSGPRTAVSVPADTTGPDRGQRCPSRSAPESSGTV